MLVAIFTFIKLQRFKQTSKFVTPACFILSKSLLDSCLCESYSDGNIIATARNNNNNNNKKTTGPEGPELGHWLLIMLNYINLGLLFKHSLYVCGCHFGQVT